MSTTEPVYISQVKIEDYTCFQGEHDFSFLDEKGKWCQWTVFLGENNTGKTNLLKAIAGLEPHFTEGANEGHFYQPIFRNHWGLVQDGKFDLEFFFRNSSSHAYWGVSSKTIMSSRLFKHYGIKHLYIYGYGVSREIEFKGISSYGNDLLNSSNLFSNSKLINFEDWLFQLDSASKNENSNDDNRKQALKRLDLLKDVLKSDVLPEIDDVRLMSDDKFNNFIEYKTADGWRKLSELGYGYKATLAWLMDFCKKMFDRYPESSDPLKEPAVLLIDEIDLHLHPRWQRGIVKYLSDLLPKTQFIVTTHSPFIIQSMEQVNLYSLQREGNHTLVKHLGIHSYIGWRIEEILSDVMDLDDDIYTDEYQRWSKQFGRALDEDNYALGKQAYDQLMKMLSPQSIERNLFELQFTQLLPDDDQA